MVQYWSTISPIIKLHFSILCTDTELFLYIWKSSKIYNISNKVKRFRRKKSVFFLFLRVDLISLANFHQISFGSWTWLSQKWMFTNIFFKNSEDVLCKKKTNWKWIHDHDLQPLCLVFQNIHYFWISRG